MGSVLAFPAGRSFEFTVRKHATLNESVKWVNTYWAVSYAAGTILTLEELGRRLVEYEKRIHLPMAYVENVEVRTGAHDGDPYDPNTFATFGYQGAGMRSGAQGDSEPLGVSLHAEKWVRTGKQGKAFYRGVLSEGDVWSPAGDAVLANQLNINTLIWDAIAASSLSDYFANGGQSGVMALVVIGANGEAPRIIMNFGAKGVTTGKRRHGWYNRVPTESPEGFADDISEQQMTDSETGVVGVNSEFIEQLKEDHTTTEYDQPEEE
jgi:hypothetical protein